MTEVLLWLFIIVLGTAFGAGIYEARVVVPLWASAPPASLKTPDSGHRFWVFVTSIPLTLLTVANFVVALQAQGPRRAWWLTATLVVLVERGATFGYFIPTMLRMQRDPTASDTSVRATLTQWARLNYLRNGLTLVAWLAALKVLSIA